MGANVRRKGTFTMSRELTLISGTHRRTERVSREERNLQQDLHKLIDVGDIEEFYDLEGVKRFRSKVRREEHKRTAAAGGAA